MALAGTVVAALLAAVVLHRSVTSEFLATDGSYSRFPGDLVMGALGDDRPGVAVANRQGEEHIFEFTLVNHSR